MVANRRGLRKGGSTATAGFDPLRSVAKPAGEDQILRAGAQWESLALSDFGEERCDAGDRR